jgi:hypothetical protein
MDSAQSLDSELDGLHLEDGYSDDVQLALRNYSGE